MGEFSDYDMCIECKLYTNISKYRLCIECDIL